MLLRFGHQKIKRSKKPRIALSLVLFCSCSLDMQAHYARLRPNLISGHFKDAEMLLDEHRKDWYAHQSDLLYLMDKSMVRFLAGDVAGSNQCIQRAKTQAQKLWTQSIAAHAQALIANDYALPYAGEDHERIFLRVLSALNYLCSNNVSEALVELTQASEMLELYQAHGDHKAVRYRDDPFVHALRAWVSEPNVQEAGQASEMWVDIKRALSPWMTQQSHAIGHGPPAPLLRLAWRTLRHLKEDTAHEQMELKAHFGAPAEALGTNEAQTDRAHVVVVLVEGEAPIKVERFVDVYMVTNVWRFASPVYVRKPRLVREAALSVGQKHATGTDAVRVPFDLVSNLEALAIANLADRIDDITARAQARAATKYALGTTTETLGLIQGGGAGLAMYAAGVLFNEATLLAERADTRSWLTMPARIHLAEAFVAPGAPINVDLSAPTSPFDGRQSLGHAGQAGSTQFFVVRAMP